jgi:hypothetical protein
MIQLLFPISDWSIIMIVGGDLLLEISHLVALPVPVLIWYGWGGEKVNN